MSTCSICNVILKFSSVTERLQCPCCKPSHLTDNISPVCRYIIEICPVLMACASIVHEKIAFCLQRSGTKYRYFIWAKRSTARHPAMVRSARSIALILASFDVSLPSIRLVNVRNRAESNERSRFFPPRVELCSVGFPLAGRYQNEQTIQLF